jgi:protein SCO1/2
VIPGRRRPRRLVPVVLVGLLCASALLAGCSSASTVPVPGPTSVTASGASPSAFQGILLDSPYPLPDATLTDTSGHDFNLRTGSDAPVLAVFFGYTNCPDICLGTLTDLATALNRVPAEVRAKVQVILITVDPDRDTPAVLRAYLDRIDPGFIGLTADLDVVKQVAGYLGVAVEGTVEVPGGGYEVTHSTQVIGFDAERLGRLVWTQGTSVGAFRADLTELVRQQG